MGYLLLVDARVHFAGNAGRFRIQIVPQVWLANHSCLGEARADLTVMDWDVRTVNNGRPADQIQSSIEHAAAVRTILHALQRGEHVLIVGT